MTSNITDATQDELINLIYHHLKDNGYQKAAHVLKKHAPKVEDEEVKVSLSEIFQKWASSDDGDVPPVPSGVETPELQSPAKTQRGSSTGSKSKITAPSAGLNPNKPVGNITTSGTAGTSTKQKTNEPGTKPRKRKNEDVLVPPSAADPGNDSDSDSSLDVDKWRKLLSEFSDVDRQKMDVLSILDESFGTIPERSRARRKPRAKKKKEESQDKKGKSDTPANEATAKSNDISVTTDASKTSSEKLKDEDAKVKKKTGNKKNSSISAPDVVETPKRAKAKTTQDEADKAQEHHEANGLLKGTKEVGVSDSEAIRTPKRVHFQPCNSFSQQIEENACKDNGTSETTQSKKTKKKKGLSEASDVETDNSPSNIQEVKKASVETHCEETNPTTDQSVTPSKKVKNKKSKSVAEPVPDETLSKKGKAKKTQVPSEIDQETTSESVNPDSSSKKAKSKASESLLETIESEIPSKKAKSKASESVLETIESEIPSKKAKSKASESLLETIESEIPSKKAKSKASESLLETIESEIPSKKAKSKASESLLETLESEIPSKKAKSKASESVLETIESEKPSKKAKIKASESVLETIESEKPSKKAKIKASESVLETIESEKPSKKAKSKASESVLETIESEKPSKKAKIKASESVLETIESEKPSKKAKSKASESVLETIESEIPSKKAKAVKEPGEVETSNKKPKIVPSDALKKKKSKMAADGVEIQHDVPSETPVKSRQSPNDVADGLGNEETASQELNTPSKKKKKHKMEEACDVPAAPEAKKDKVKSKIKKGENADAPPPPEEEEEAAMSQKKKKKKKTGEETEGIVPESAPVEELLVHKKKKKKEKALSSDEARGLNST
ncbi:hypothetical protein R3I93_015138 [Phoxinus phoxinus]|uniref:LisH domain-containing protein n=1 Tax=Phoxinus phoxinus TaxID=58324 RepID=A0AAN9CMT6_9TELE